MEKTGCKIICGAPTTLAVKELMMMMMMTGKRDLDEVCYQRLQHQALASPHVLTGSLLLLYRRGGKEFRMVSGADCI